MRNQKYASLNPGVLHILRDKGTEKPFSGEYPEDVWSGSYLCRGCGAALFRADSQFSSGCGWPSFDDQVSGAVKKQLDADGVREEIVCANCQGHLGHVFQGEGKTPKNLRHCVNALAIEFVEDDQVLKTEEIIVAGGCFWGVQHILNQLPGVLLTEAGYSGGHVDHPTYRQVCTKTTGHFESVRVIFDIGRVSLQAVLQCFFELHNFSQKDGQGPDIGSQYRSAIFYFNDEQKACAESVIDALVRKGFDVATELKAMAVFWPAEKDHQAYYEKHSELLHCHVRKRLFFNG